MQYLCPENVLLAEDEVVPSTSLVEPENSPKENIFRDKFEPIFPSLVLLPPPVDAKVALMQENKISLQSPSSIFNLLSPTNRSEQFTIVYKTNKKEVERKQEKSEETLTKQEVFRTKPKKKKFKLGKNGGYCLIINKKSLVSIVNPLHQVCKFLFFLKEVWCGIYLFKV